LPRGFDPMMTVSLLKFTIALARYNVVPKSSTLKTRFELFNFRFVEWILFNVTKRIRENVG
jgi:hypothetical protein